MLVAKLEIWPYGHEEGRFEVGQVVVGNDGTGTHDYGNYKAYVLKPGMHPKDRKEKGVKLVQRIVTRFYRPQKDGYWKVLALVLRLLFPTVQRRELGRLWGCYRGVIVDGETSAGSFQRKLEVIECSTKSNALRIMKKMSKQNGWAKENWKASDFFPIVVNFEEKKPS